MSPLTAIDLVQCVVWAYARAVYACGVEIDDNGVLVCGAHGPTGPRGSPGLCADSTLIGWLLELTGTPVPREEPGAGTPNAAFSGHYLRDVLKNAYDRLMSMYGDHRDEVICVPRYAHRTRVIPRHTYDYDFVCTALYGAVTVPGMLAGADCGARTHRFDTLVLAGVSTAHACVLEDDVWIAAMAPEEWAGVEHLIYAGLADTSPERPRLMRLMLEYQETGGAYGVPALAALATLRGVGGDTAADALAHTADVLDECTYHTGAKTRPRTTVRVLLSGAHGDEDDCVRLRDIGRVRLAPWTGRKKTTEARPADSPLPTSARGLGAPTPPAPRRRILRVLPPPSGLVVDARVQRPARVQARRMRAVVAAGAAAAEAAGGTLFSPRT